MKKKSDQGFSLWGLSKYYNRYRKGIDALIENTFSTFTIECQGTINNPLRLWKIYDTRVNLNKLTKKEKSCKSLMYCQADWIWSAMIHFYKDGWRNIDGKILCKFCVKDYKELKKSNKKKGK